MRASTCCRSHSFFSPERFNSIRSFSSVMKLLTDEYAVDPNSLISQMVYDDAKDLLYLSNVYIDLGDYVGIYLCGGQIVPQELENPLDLKADTEDKKFICFNTIMVSTTLFCSSSIIGPRIYRFLLGLLYSPINGSCAKSTFSIIETQSICPR